MWLVSMNKERELPPRSYTFDGAMPEEVLHNYLSRSVQLMDLFWVAHDDNKREEWLRFIAHTGAKLIGRSAMIWSNFQDDEVMFGNAGEMAKAVHAQDPEVILQAAIFETTADSVNEIPIPAWVFEAFGLEPEQRNFSYAAMLYENGRYLNNWGEGKSVPDITKLETRLFFYYRAARFIDLGYEAIHFGQVKLMGELDEGYEHWSALLEQVRAYAAAQGRRHNVLLDAHINEHFGDSGQLAFDFISFPARMAAVNDIPQETKLEVGYMDAIYGMTIGGMHPQGYQVERSPFLVELDNYGGNNGTPGKNSPFWPWGYDEIAWFAHQEAEYRHNWLAYAHDWLQTNDPAGYLQMPGYRTLGFAPVGERAQYNAINPSPVFPGGFGDEDAIKAIWEGTWLQGTTIEDDLSNWTKLYRASRRVIYDGRPAAGFSAAEQRLTNKSGRGEYVVYKAPYGSRQFVSFSVLAWLDAASPEAELLFYISEDDEQYTRFLPEKTILPTDQEASYTATQLPKGSRYLKIEFSDTPGASQLGRVRLGYDY